MAISINTQPNANDILSPYRPLEITATSTATVASDPNLYTVKMKCFIYLDGSATAINANSAIVLDPNLNSSYTFTFDLSGFLSGLESLTTDIQTEGLSVDPVVTSNSLREVTVKFEEILFNETTRLLEVGAQSSASNKFLLINGVWQHDEYVGSYGELDDYMMADGAEGKFLTNFRGAREIGVNDSAFLSGICQDTGTNVIKINVYTGKNRTGSVNSYYRTMSGFPSERFDLPVGSANINATTGFWFNSSGTSRPDPVIDSSVGSYSVQIVSNISAFASKLSERLTFNVDHKLNGKETRIKFLNRLGAFEYFNFKGYKDESISVKNNYYNRALGSSYGLHEGGDRVLSSDINKEFTIYSQMLTNDVKEFLTELLDGHECYVLEGSNYLPIKIKTGKTNIVNESSQLATIQLGYQLSNKVKRQNGGY